MEFIKVGEYNLKISLTEEDMERYRLSEETLDYHSSETRAAFREILAEAQRQTGFITAADRMMIQVFPSRDGGCEIFVCRPDTPEDAPQEEPAGTAYCFDGMGDLLCACRLLAGQGYNGASQAYRDGTECYFLLLDGEGAPALSEFVGQALPPEASYIREHHTCVAEKDAVHTLGALAL